MHVSVIVGFTDSLIVTIAFENLTTTTIVTTIVRTMVNKLTRQYMLLETTPDVGQNKISG